MSKIVIAGSRDFEDKEVIYSCIQKGLRLLKSFPTEVFSGKCPTGVDKIGEQWAFENGVDVRPFKAAWKSEGSAAGPIRNARMAFFCDKGIVIIKDLSRGASNMARELARNKKDCVTFHIREGQVVSTYLNDMFVHSTGVVNNTIFFE